MSSKFKDYIVKGLRVIYLGKYQTTFYNKDEMAFQSSITGGLITILLVTLISAAILSQLVAVFSKSHYNLDIESDLIKAYQFQDMNDHLPSN